jgi:uncharacterized OB-fold protein
MERPDHLTLKTRWELPVTEETIPAVPYLRLDQGRAQLIGSRCGACNAVFPGERTVCGSCGSRSDMMAHDYPDRGTLYNFTVVHRSFPGVKTPFVMAIVDMEGGGALRGTLLDAGTDVGAIERGSAVDVVYRDTGQRDADGRAYISHYFVPAAESKL